MNAVAEVRWFLVNYALLNAYWFVFGLVQGIVLLASYAGTITGHGGTPVEQVFWYAIGVVFYWPLVFGIPVLLAALLVVAAAIRIERTEPLYLAIVLAAVIGYATIVRLPPGPPMPQAA